MSEIWTAIREEPSKQDGNPFIIFSVLDEETSSVREERRYQSALPLMLALGGYPPQLGAVLMLQPFPWRFRKTDDEIYIDGPSVGADDYHPITNASPAEQSFD